MGRPDRHPGPDGQTDGHTRQNLYILTLRAVKTTVLQPFIWDYLGEPVPEEAFIHSLLSWSSTIFYELCLSTTIHGILPVQFTCLTVFLYTSLQVLFGPPLGLKPYTSLHTFVHPWLGEQWVNKCMEWSEGSFCNTCPYHICFAAIPRLRHLQTQTLNTDIAAGNQPLTKRWSNCSSENYLCLYWQWDSADLSHYIMFQTV